MTRTGHVQRVVVQLSTEHYNEGSYSTNAAMTCRLHTRDVRGRDSQDFAVSRQSSGIKLLKSAKVTEQTQA